MATTYATRQPLDTALIMRAAHHRNRHMQHMGRALRLTWQAWKLYGIYDLPGTGEIITPADSRYAHLATDGRV